ncbi:MAG: ATP-dependent DNA helicase [Spirochaetota bacterium]
MNSEQLHRLFSPHGLLAANQSGFELRDGQLQMSELVLQALSDDLLLVVEAGTGIGKSFAYLVPALQWCAEHEDERIVVATSTIPLQHQLAEKDIPFLLRAMNLPLQSAVLKGRSNYVCLRRLEQHTETEGQLDQSHLEALQRLKQWAQVTQTGDKAELEWSVPPGLWFSVCSEVDTCLGFRCPWRESCFVNRARKLAQEAHIVIINHHLLFANLLVQQEEAESALLPEFTRLVIDEAHNIEKNAVSYFTQTYSSRQLYGQLYTLAHTRQGTVTGLVERLRTVCEHPAACNEMYQLINDLKASSDALDKLLIQLISGARGSHILRAQRVSAHKQLLTQGRDVCDLLEKATSVLDTIIEASGETPQRFEAQAVSSRLHGHVEVLEHLLRFDLAESHVYWLEHTLQRDRETVAVHITPISFAQLLNEGLFSLYRTVICTSATLTVQRSFAYWEEKVGLAQEQGSRLVEEIIPSPFDYRNRVMLAVTGEAPSPSDYPAYFAYSASCIDQLVSSLEGGALVLFTSYAMMDQMHAELAGKLSLQGLQVLKQGDLDRYKMMRTFVDNEHSVLFATQSFWEGVDAPGNTLRLLIICRIPFQVPTDPLYTAKAEKITSQGGKPFFQLSLPEAVIRMKQGYGRLMRTSADRGIVCLLDSRVVQKGYGKIILDSLPQTPLVQGSLSHIVERVEDFFFQKKG